MDRTVTLLKFMLFGAGVFGYYHFGFVGREIKPAVTTGSGFSWDKILGHKELIWDDCDQGFKCARLLVPLNYSNPSGRQASIAIIQKPAMVSKDSALHRGPILFNPGGPGGSGVDIVRLRGELLSTIVGPQFDIVGFDPRGVARSLPAASFFTTDVERVLWGQALRIVNNSDEGIARTWARASVVGQLAGETDDGYLRHINTENTARDMLRIVEAHRRSRIQYWGFSYGTVLGATFAAMFPDKIERLVLDGVVDAYDYYSNLHQLYGRRSLLDTDKTMESFYTGCADAGPDACPFWAPTARDIERNLTTLYNTLRSKPLPIRTKSGYGLLDYPMLRSAIFSALYTPYASFPAIAQGLAELAVGDGQMLFDRMHMPMFHCKCDHSERLVSTIPDATFTVLCNDGEEVPSDLASAEKYFAMLTNSSSWGEIWATIRLGCVSWPKFPKDHFQGPFQANTNHPILFIGNTADPVTPLAGAKKMSASFNGSVLLVQDSPGHGSFAAPSVCTQKYVREYLLDGTLPKPGTVCQPIGSPFPIDGSEFAADGSQSTLSSHMSPEEMAVYMAVLELSKDPGIMSPLH